MRPGACRAIGALERAFPVADGELREHLAHCARCGAAWTGWKQLADLGRALPAKTLGEARRQSLRDAVVLRAIAQPGPASAARSRRARVALAITACVAAAIAATALVALRPSREEVARAPAAAPLAPPRATVHTAPGSTYARVGAPPDEIVRLTEGTITVEIAPLSPEQRFRVVTGDAEVEVRGTIFEVEARGDRILSVYVLRGRVEVRRIGDAAFLLRAGERWRAIDPATATPPSPTVTAEAREGPARQKAATAPPAAPHPSARPDELRYQEGWGALRAGDLLRAAAAFEEVAAGEGTLAAEALYWRAVALGRAGHGPEAASALEAYLRGPAPARGDEAAAMLGWLLFERGDARGAAPLFARAARSAVTAARDSGRRGLEALGPSPTTDPPR